MATARNAVRALMENPNSFTGSPGYKFALDAGQQAISRRMGRGSGNVLAALADHAVGTAQQDYGNEFGRRLSAASLEQQGDLAGQGLDLDRERLALERETSGGRLALDRDRFGLEDALGRSRLDLDRDNSERDFGLGMFRATSDYDLGSRGLDDAREGRWLTYDTARRGQDIDVAESENRYNLGRDAASRGWYDSRTNRGRARADSYWRGRSSGG